MNVRMTLRKKVFMKDNHAYEKNMRFMGQRILCRMSFMLGIQGLLLTGCGFSPLMESRHRNFQAPITIHVRGVEGYSNYALEKEVRHQLELVPFHDPLTLRIQLRQTNYDTGYGQDALSLRTQNVLTAAYELESKGVVLGKGVVDSVSSYNLDRNDAFSTLTSRVESDEALLKALGLELSREVFRIFQKSLKNSTQKSPTHSINQNI